MKKRLVVLACLVATLVVVPVARAGEINTDTDYQGRVEHDPNTWFGFDVDKVNGHKKVRHTVFYAPVACRDSNGGQFHLLARIEGAFRIRDHRFHGTGELFTMGGGTAKVTGRLRSGGRAKGTLDVHYTSPGETCYSGILDWRAQRGSEVPFPVV